MSVFCFFLGGRGLGRQPSPSRHFFSKNMQNQFSKKNIFSNLIAYASELKTVHFVRISFLWTRHETRRNGDTKNEKKSEKTFQKKNRKIFLRFFFGVCPCYYLAIPKKKKWKKWKPGSGGAPVLGHSSPKGYAFIARRCRWHSPWQGPTYPGRGL